MKGNESVIDNLKEILTNELTAVNQYFLHSRMCKDWGYEKLADTFYKEAIDEMKHAREIIDRILFLEGAPNLQKLHPLKIGTTVKQQFQNDLSLEHKAIDDLKKSIDICIKNADFASKEILESILVSEEEHIDWIESQLHLIKEIGEENYLSQQLSV
ncbi:MAG: bacterioferritin [Bdellovibrionaceae bacterium]|nr:bacterioferritin [Pseudobdellovibrionaceae bacterium]